MRKQVISIAIAAVLATANAANAFTFGAGAVDLGRSVPSLPKLFSWSSSKKKTSPQKNPPPQHYVELINLIKQQLEINKKQFEQEQKIQSSIMSGSKSKAIKTDHTSFFLKNPELIYKNGQPNISALLAGILQEEEISTSIRQSRNSIGQRIQYATAIDKAIGLQTFQETENRFKQISELVEQINTTTDLKSIAELQARIKGMLAMIQNEATKLQMVAYSRKAEQALINQQKQKRNMIILNSENKGMPTIRSIR
ncbi:conjugal transfer protein [Bartonella sp. 220]|uniref:type IV secretion system protein n=1 Tax=Bartonella sp. 220B TaxID=2967260 RepID=UPI0022A96404|nr:type IV secretion system protein [Bartonella sp. 220B]MCZ2157910.1 conjugal transfer protein [Bartonella sp. 220B]